MNISIQGFIWKYVFIALGYGPRSVEMMGHVVILSLTF